MKDLNFYVNKNKALLLLVTCCVFTFCGIFLRKSLYDFEEKPFKTIILLFGFLIFLLGIVMNVILLIRKTPLLTVTETKIIIYNVFGKTAEIRLDEIQSFYTITTYIRGVSNSSIYIKLIGSNHKPHQYSIQSNFLNVSHDKLLDVLNKKIKNVT